MSNNPQYEATNYIEELKDGSKGWALKPKALNIIWGDDSRYWIMPTGPDEPAKLLQVCWLEITGSTKPLTKGSKYEISFTISLTGAFGWKDCPVFLMAKIGKKGKYKWQKIILSDLEENKIHDIPSNSLIIEVDCNCHNDDLVLYFGLYEVWTLKWKGGLNIHRVEVKEIST